MLLDQLSLHLRRRLRVVRKLHSKLALTLRSRTELGREAKHGIQRDISKERELVDTDISLLDDGVALVHEANNVTLELVGRGDDDLHEGLEDNWAGVDEGLAEGLGGSVLEGHFGGVGHMGSTIVDLHISSENLVVKQGTLLARSHETLLASKQELFGDGSSKDLVLKLVLGEGAGRLHVPDDTGVISRTSSLLLESVVKVDLLGDGLAVGDLGLAGFAVDAILAAHTLDVNVEMELAHTRDDGLLGLLVDVDAEGGVLTLETGHGLGEVGRVLGVLGLDGEGDDGFGDEHGGLQELAMEMDRE